MKGETATIVTASSRWQVAVVVLLSALLVICACGSKAQGTWHVRVRGLHAYDCAIDSAGSVWLTTQPHGLWVLDQRGILSPVRGEVVENSTILQIAFAPDGDLWGRTASGDILTFDGMRWHRFDVSPGVGSNAVQVMFIDSVGAIWFASNEEIAQLESGIWHTISLPGQLAENSDNKVRTLLVNVKQEVLWLGTARGGIWSCSFKGDWKEHQLLPNASIGEVGALHMDPSDRLWAGTEAGIFSWEAGEWIHHGSPRDDPPFGITWAIAIDKSGRVWIGGTGGIGMLSADGKSWTYFEKQAQERTPGWVTAIEMDMAGTLWFAGVGGVSQFVPFDHAVETLSAAIF